MAGFWQIFLLAELVFVPVTLAIIFLPMFFLISFVLSGLFQVDPEKYTGPYFKLSAAFIICWDVFHVLNDTYYLGGEYTGRVPFLVAVVSFLSGNPF